MTFGIYPISCIAPIDMAGPRFDVMPELTGNAGEWEYLFSDKKLDSIIKVQRPSFLKD